MAEPGAPPAGWLLDPDDPTLLRWWDGAAWGAFRRQRDPAPSPAATPTPAAPPPAPSTAPLPVPVPRVTAVAWTPHRPDVGVPVVPRAAATPAAAPARPARPARTARTAAPVTRPPTAAPTSSGPEPFTSQWDGLVVDTLGALTDDARRRRAAVFAGVRRQVVAEAADDEEVFEAFPVTIHDEHRSGDRLGATRIGADLFVTDRRLLLVVDRPRWDDALVTVEIDDILVVTGLPGAGVVLDLAGEGPPLLLRAARSARRRYLLELLLSLVEDVPGPDTTNSHRAPDLAGDFGVEVAAIAGRRARGVEVLVVGHGSAAARLGITPGDHISAIDGAEVRSARDLALVFATYAAGEEVTVTWSSGSRTFEAGVVL